MDISPTFELQQIFLLLNPGAKPCTSNHGIVVVGSTLATCGSIHIYIFLLSFRVSTSAF